jgi:hypothetical protein
LEAPEGSNAAEEARRNGLGVIRYWPLSVVGRVSVAVAESGKSTSGLYATSIRGGSGLNFSGSGRDFEIKNRT